VNEECQCESGGYWGPFGHEGRRKVAQKPKEMFHCIVGTIEAVLHDIRSVFIFVLVVVSVGVVIFKVVSSMSSSLPLRYAAEPSPSAQTGNCSSNVQGSGGLRYQEVRS
jgi:hypothetical protein